VLSLWHLYEKTNLTQDEVTTSKEVGFFLFEKLKCHSRNLFNDYAILLVNKLANVDS
jgi:hypothetical protein